MPPILRSYPEKGAGMRAMARLSRSLGCPHQSLLLINQSPTLSPSDFSLLPTASSLHQLPNHPHLRAGLNLEHHACISLHLLASACIHGVNFQLFQIQSIRLSSTRKFISLEIMKHLVQFISVSSCELVRGLFITSFPAPGWLMNVLGVGQSCTLPVTLINYRIVRALFCEDLTILAGLVRFNWISIRLL